MRTAMRRTTRRSCKFILVRGHVYSDVYNWVCVYVCFKREECDHAKPS